MFGLSFVQQAFLFTGLAAAIPVAIHLLLRQRARSVDIGSVRFLRRVVRQQNRMRRLREWLLLAARIVTVLLLAFLFARPFVDRTALQAGEREILFLLDRSASMRLAASGEAVYDAAKEALGQELNQVHENTAVRIAVFDADGVEELDGEGAPRVPPPSYAGTDYGRALGWARDTLSQSDRPDRLIVVLTDLQRIGLGPPPWESWSPALRLKIRDFGQPLTRNVAIERVDVISTEIRPKLPPSIRVAVRNASASRTGQFDLRLQLSGPAGRLEQVERLTLSGGERASVTFAIDDAQPGRYQGSAEIAIDDDLDFDNRRFVALEARRPDRLLIVDGQEGGTVFGNETYFLETALRLGRQLADPGVPTFETERIVWENGEGFPSLDGFRALALANVGRFSDTDAARLGDYLRAGGCVILFAGDQLTRRATRPLARAGLLPADIQGVRGLGDYRLTKWDAEHPIFSPFDEPQHGDLRRLQFRQVADLEPVGDARVLASCQREQPLLIERQIGAGRALLLASTIDAAWSDWPQSRLYVPLVRQVFAYLTDQHVRASQIVTQPADSAPPGIVPQGDVTIVRNVDPDESALDRITPEQFREAFRLPSADAPLDLSPAELAALAPPADSQRPNELWPMVAWFLLLWLIVETFLAGRVHA
jgi:hypothetical protein